MTNSSSEPETGGHTDPATLDCPACGRTFVTSDFLRDQIRYRCVECRTVLSTMAVMKFLYADAVESPFAPAAPASSAAEVPLFRREGFWWVMIYFLVATCLLFVGDRAPQESLLHAAQAQKTAAAEALAFAVKIAHFVAAGAVLTRTRVGLYTAYAFLGGRALVGLLSGAPPQPYGIGELLMNWAGWGMAVAAPIAALAWLAINSHYFGPRRP